MLIGPPLIQLVVFGYAASFELKDIPYGVFNEDRGHLSRNFEAALAGAPSFRRVATLDSESEIAPLLGSLPALYAGLALFLLSGVGVGQLVRSLCRPGRLHLLVPQFVRRHEIPRIPPNIPKEYLVPSRLPPLFLNCGGVG